MKLSCVIPATDQPPALTRCLAAIRDAERPPEELIVVTEPAAAGPAAARNRGSQQASGDVLVFVDSDVLVHADAFARVRAAFEHEPALAAVFGSYDDAPEAPGAVSGFRNLLHHHVHQQGAGVAGTFWAGLGAVRREAFLAAGGFDSDRYPAASIEDIELGMRLAERGGLVRLDPMLRGTHLKRWGLTQMVRTDYESRGLPWARLLLRSRQVPSTLNLGWRHRLSMIASAAAAGALAIRRPRLAGLALLSLVALNAGFYRLVWRNRGPSEGIAAVGLHALHHLTGAVSFAAAAIEALTQRLSGNSGPLPPPATEAHHQPRQGRLMNELGTPSTGSSPTTSKPNRS